MTNTETGLPELPEGYFWRVVEIAAHITRVELRKKAWLGSRRVRSCRYYESYHTVREPGERILSCALGIMKEFHDPWAEFYGDYPPKSLLGSKMNAAEDAADKEETNGND